MGVRGEWMGCLQYKKGEKYPLHFKGNGDEPVSVKIRVKG